MAMSKQAGIWWNAVNDSQLISGAWSEMPYDNMDEHAQAEVDRVYEDAVRISLLKCVG